MSHGWFLGLAAVVAGGLASEGFVRAILEPDAFFEISFSDGAQSPSDTYGFVFTPGFRGMMRHPHRVWGTPFSLEEHGFRQPARSAGAGTDPVRVVLLGGRSATMCYGLPDHRTIQHYMAERTSLPLEVWNTGWAGFDSYRSWRFYEDTLGKELPVELVLFCFNPDRPEDLLGQFPADMGPIPTHPKQPEFWDMMKGNVRLPKDGLERWMGSHYFDSYVAYGILKYRRRLAFLGKSLGRLTGAEETSILPPVPEGPLDDLQRRGLERLGEFIAEVRDVLAGRGTRLAVVFIPSFGRAPDCYRLMDGALPADVPRLDLHRELFPRMRPADWIATIHYGDAQSRLIAERLERYVVELLPAGEEKQ